MKNVLKIFYHDTRNHLLDETAAKVLVDSIYNDDKGSINWWKFILFIKEQLIYLNTLLKFYFSFKFLSKSLRFRLPKLTKSSYIFNNELLGLLFLSNAFIQTSKEIEYLYSAAAGFFDYKQFTDKLLGIFFCGMQIFLNF